MTNKHRFSERWLTRLRAPTDREQVEYWDATVTGLHVIVRRSGRKSYYVRLKGRRKRKLGEVLGEGPTVEKRLKSGAAITLEDAKKMALEARSAPQLRIAARAHAVQTVADVYERWCAQRAPEMAPKTVREYKRSIELDVLPTFGDRQPEELSADELVGWMESIGEPEPVGRGAPIQANRAKAHLSSILRWACKRRYCSANPLKLVEWKYPENKKQTVYSNSEIGRLWDAWLDSSGLVTRVFRLVLCTCQRPGEVAAMAWDRVEKVADGIVWTIEDSKNGHRHYVPLEPLALEILDELRPLTGHGRWVFPKRGADHQYLSSWESELARTKERCDMPHFDAHSLRRTAASWMATLGVERGTIQDILHHTPGGATSHYVYAQGASPRCREALRLLEGHLREVIAG